MKIFINGKPATPDDTVTVETSLGVADFAESVRAECERRILSHADRNTQINLAGAASAGFFDESQLTAFKSGIQWIGLMRAASQSMIAANDADYASDTKWPDPSQAAMDLAAQF